ncbi:uncharacterized protein At4g08330, chloroplastic [Dendrobium catenatum]|uniref:Uncharacterized protein n=1 Tax=Dendrobium catenatum TaxID=906689 RepID=A0A2I0VU27_9ASPA|nr:uncharacterized protein At4g08330, chloroplastic [Dendrobium catenatum]PKU66889.1 Uncharacterized protein MA16_Dca021571 [Dendrobium catenatum]
MPSGDVAYSCGSCGYPLNLTSSKEVASSQSFIHKRSTKKDMLYFPMVDLSRFTQVDELSCFPFSLSCYKSKIKLLCRKCGIHIGYGYGQFGVLCGSDVDSVPSSSCKKYIIKVRAIQPSEQ